MTNTLTVKAPDLRLTVVAPQVIADAQPVPGEVNTRATRAGHTRVTRGGHSRVTRGITWVHPIKLTVAPPDLRLAVEEP